MQYDSEEKKQATDEHPDEVENRRAALDAAKHGLRVFPVRVTRHPMKPDKKKVVPLVKNWSEAATTDSKKIDEWWKRYPDAAPGMPTDEFCVIDLDDRGEKSGTAEYRALGLEPDASDVVVETPSGGLHLYHNNPTRLRNSQDNIAPGIDVRGEGGFVFAPGARTLFGTYRIKKGCLAHLQFGVLSKVPDQIRSAVQRDAKPVDSAPVQKVTHAVETLRDALRHIPNDGSYDDWTETLMAVHHATAGSEEGLAIALGWSAGYEGFTFSEIRAKWQSFGRYRGSVITVDILGVTEDPRSEGLTCKKIAIQVTA